MHLSKKRPRLDSTTKTKPANLRYYNNDDTTNNNKNPSFPPQLIRTSNRRSFRPMGKPTLLQRRRKEFLEK